MRITRQMGEAELVALRRFLARLPEGRKLRRNEYLGSLGSVVMIAFAGLVIVWIRNSLQVNPWWLPVPALVIAGLVWHPIWRVLDRRADGRFVRANQAELGPQEFWVDADGFGNATPAGSTFHRWHTVREVHDAERFTVILVSPRLYTIPAGADRDEYVRFVAELKRCRESSPPPPSEA